MAQRAHTTQMVLKLIINRTNTFLRFQVSLYVPFSYTEEPEMSRFSFQKSGHPRLQGNKNKITAIKVPYFNYA
jgi:hypothetical protein